MSEEGLIFVFIVGGLMAILAPRIGYYFGSSTHSSEKVIPEVERTIEREIIVEPIPVKESRRLEVD